MKLITTNLLNRFWQKGIKPIKELIGDKKISGIGDGTITGAISSLNTGLTTTSGIVSGPYIDATWYKKSDICRIKFAGPVKQDISANTRITLFQLPFVVVYYKMIALGPDAIGFFLIENGKVDMVSYSNLMGGNSWIYADETFII